MVAIVVFPQPGGPHKIVEGKRSSAMSLPSDESAANAFWPTKSDNFLGRTRSAKGLLLVAAAAPGLFRFIPGNMAWSSPMAEEYFCEFVDGLAASAFFDFEKGGNLCPFKFTPDNPEGVTVAAAESGAACVCGLALLLEATPASSVVPAGAEKCRFKAVATRSLAGAPVFLALSSKDTARDLAPDPLGRTSITAVTLSSFAAMALLFGAAAVERPGTAAARRAPPPIHSHMPAQRHVIYSYHTTHPRHNFD